MNQPRPTNRLPQPNLLPPQNFLPAGNVQMYNPYAANQVSSSNGSWGPPPSQPQEQQVKDPWNWDDNTGSSPSHLESKPPAHLAHNLNNHPPPMYSSQDFLQNHPIPHFPSEQHQTNNNQYDNSGNKQNWGWNDDHAQQSNQNGVSNEPISANNPNNYQPALHMPPPPGNGLPTTLEHGMNNMSLSSREEPQLWESQLNSQSNFPPSRDEVPSWSGAPSWGSLGVLPPTENRDQPHQFSGLGERSTFADGASFSDGSQVPTYPTNPSSTQLGLNGAFSQQLEESVSPYPHYPPPTSHPSMVPVSGPPVSETLNSATGHLAGPPIGFLAGPPTIPVTTSAAIPASGPPVAIQAASSTAPPTGPLNSYLNDPSTDLSSGSPTEPLTGLLTDLSTGSPTGPPTGPPTSSPTGPLTDLSTGPPTGLVTGPPTGRLAGPPTGLLTGPPTGLLTGPPTGRLAGPPTGPLTGPPTGLLTGPLAGPPTGPLAGPPTGLVTGPPTGLLTSPPTGRLAGPPTGPLAGPPTGSLTDLSAGPPTEPPTGSLISPLAGPPTGPSIGLPAGPLTGYKDHTEAMVDSRPQPSPVVMPLPVSHAVLAPSPLYVSPSAPPMSGFNRIETPPSANHQGTPHLPSLSQSLGI